MLTKIEKYFAKLLSSNLVIKQFVKSIYTIPFTLLGSLVLKSKIKGNIVEFGEDNKESFFGYYDIKPDNLDGMVLCHQSTVATHSNPDPSRSIEVCIFDMKEPGRPIFSAISNAYNWQQGTRLQWLDQKKFIFNDFDKKRNRYVSRVIDSENFDRKQTVDMPIQSLINKNEFLSLNYQRLAALRPDYGYFNLSPSDIDLDNMQDDGIWKVNIKENTSKLIYSLDRIVNFKYLATKEKTFHKINHLMVSPDKNKFLILHRSFANNSRYGRLLVGDVNGNNLVELPTDKMVSHYTWLTNHLVLGYVSVKGKKDGYYIINIDTLSIEEMPNLNAVTLGDGHPIVSRDDEIITDSYPDRFGYQSLFIQNLKNNKTKKVAYLKHPRNFKLENRCDLHPKASIKRDSFYFDSVMTGKRRFYQFMLK